MKVLGFQQLADGSIAVVIDPGKCRSLLHLESSLGDGLFLWPSGLSPDAGADVAKCGPELVRRLRGMADQVETVLRDPAGHTVRRVPRGGLQ